MVCVQNPENCDNVKLFVYSIHSLRSGFGSQTHVMVMHFLQAFYTNRTFVLESKNWHYDKEGWDHYMMPLGKCRYNEEIQSLPIQSGKTDITIVKTSLSLKRNITIVSVKEVNHQ